MARVSQRYAAGTEIWWCHSAHSGSGTILSCVQDPLFSTWYEKECLRPTRWFNMNCHHFCKHSDIQVLDSLRQLHRERCKNAMFESGSSEIKYTKMYKGDPHLKKNPYDSIYVFLGCCLENTAKWHLHDCEHWAWIWKRKGHTSRTEFSPCCVSIELRKALNSMLPLPSAIPILQLAGGKGPMV